MSYAKDIFYFTVGVTIGEILLLQLLYCNRDIATVLR